MRALYKSPFKILRGKLFTMEPGDKLDTYQAPHAGIILKRESPHPNAKTFTAERIMEIHKLTGQLHSESGQTPGYFLKMTDPAHFAWEPHGLTAADVGALAVNGTAVNSAALNSQAATYYTNADNLASGTVPDARLRPYRLWSTAATPVTAILVDTLGYVGIGMTATRRLSVDGIIGWARDNTDVELARLSSTSADGNNPAIVATEGKYLLIMTQPTGGSATIRIKIAADGTVTLPAMSTAGILKNAATGVLSGGNTITASEISNATTTPTANSLPLSGAAVTTIAAGWLPTEIGNHTANTFPLGRFRGSVGAKPTTDLRAGDYCVYANGTASLGVYDGTAWWLADLTLWT